MKQEKQDGHAEGNRVIQYNTIKVRLCPTPEQEELFQKTFGCCRYIWNQMLSDHERFYEEKAGRSCRCMSMAKTARI